MCVSLFGTTRRSFPTNARPVATTRFSPAFVSGISVKPVCWPVKDHSVSPWRTINTRGVDMAPSPSSRVVKGSCHSKSQPWDWMRCPALQMQCKWVGDPWFATETPRRRTDAQRSTKSPHTAFRAALLSTSSLIIMEGREKSKR